MLLSKSRMTAAASTLLVVLWASLVGVDANDSTPKTGRTDVPANPALPESANSPAREDADLKTWRLRLREAIRIGLDNSEIIRVLSACVCSSKNQPPRNNNFSACGGQLVGWHNCEVEPTGCSEDPKAHESLTRFVIEPVSAETDLQKFRVEVMAEVRSVAQHYAMLSLRHAQLQECEKSLKLAEEILKREKAEAGLECRGTIADIAEAQQRLEQLQLDRVARTVNVLTAERQLRKILGLPLDDDRRIIPITPPIEPGAEPDWEKCMATMLEKQPDVVKAKADLEVVHQASHSLARCFREQEANRKHGVTASRYRAKAAKVLEAQRAFYEEGRITIDRYLNAAGQYADSVSQEADFQHAYTLSFIALEEAKGTLLDFEGITVSQIPGRGPKPDR
jgi:hypothetical protein